MAHTPWGILWISGVGDDRRIFLGRNIIFLGGWLDLSRDFFGYSKQSRDYFVLVPAYDNFRWDDEKTNTNNQFLMFLFFMLYHFFAFWKFLKLGNLA